MGTQESVRVAPFVDPISLREMNGSVKFLYRHCGCVLSEMTLKEMRKAEGEGGRTDVCPVCVKVDGKEVWERWVTINPKGEEAEMMRDVWEKVREREKEEKKAAKGLKRKKEGGEGERKEKKVKSKEEGPSINKGASVPKLSATLAAQLAESKKSNSPAIASLYAPKDGDPDHVRPHLDSLLPSTDNSQFSEQGRSFYLDDKGCMDSIRVGDVLRRSWEGSTRLLCKISFFRILSVALSPLLLYASHTQLPPSSSHHLIFLPLSLSFSLSLSLSLSLPLSLSPKKSLKTNALLSPSPSPLFYLASTGGAQQELGAQESSTH
jgi:hypothetical protein